MAADRTVKVTLRAVVNDYVAGMDKAAQKTRETGTEAEKLGQKSAAFQTLGTAALAVGTLAAAGVAIAVGKFAEFDAQMSAVQAATNESAENMGSLRQAALDAGADTVFSASESAQAITELGKAGLSTADILGGGLTGALDLAAAGQLGVARAAEISAITLSQFNLKGSDASRVADTLAAGANKALGSVDDLANGLKFVGPIASSMGVSLEETTGVLALFAQQGIIGEQAGTSLRGVLASLTSPSAQARAEIERLGITLYDSEGGFLGLENAAGELSTAYGDMDGASRDASLGVIFGRETVTAATALYKAGAGGVAEWTGAVTDSGFAAEQAAILLDNLKGDFEALTGSLETGFIAAGSGANDSLRLLVQSATDAVNAFNNLDPAAQQASLGIGAVIAGGSLAAGAFFTVVPKIAEFNSALETMGPRAQTAGKLVGGLAKGLGLLAGLGAAAVVLDNLANSGYDAALGIEATTKALNNADFDSLFAGASSDVTDYSSALQLLFGGDINSQMERFGSTLNGAVFGGQLSDQVAETREQFDTMGQALANLVSAGDAAGAAQLFRELSVEAEAQGISTEELIELFPQYTEALAGLGNEQEIAAGKTGETTDGLALMGEAANTAEEDISTLADAIAGFGSQQLDVNSATREFESAIDSLTDSVAANGSTMDLGTEAGRANQAALDAIASSSLGLAAATLERTGSEDEAAAAVQRGRDELIKSLAQFGITGQAAEDYADDLGLIPSDVKTTATQIGFDEAIRKANLVADAIRNIPGRRDVVISQVVEQTGAARGLVAASYATGGAISGPGSGTSDTAGLFRLSNGEHVLTAAEVARMGGQAAVYDFRRNLNARQDNQLELFARNSARSGGYATGGAVAASGPFTLPPMNITVQSKGGIDLLKYVEVVANGVVVAADRSSSSTLSAGKSRDY